MEKILYKYRGIKNFRLFVDIILKNRLHAAKYTELNDPMEGQFYYNKGIYDKSLIQKISSDKEDLRICSLSRTKKHELMWSHYAEGQHGVAIGITVDEKYDLRLMQYGDLSYFKGEQINHDTAREILTHKLSVWTYEEEERIFISSSSIYIDVQIKEIITGRAMSPQDFSFIKELVGKINPSIKIIKADSFM